ncbi:MAG: hypothetical protein WC022_00740 [Parcubacteria group bacterium]
MQKNIARGLLIGALVVALGLPSFGSVASASVTAKTKITKEARIAARVQARTAKAAAKAARIAARKAKGHKRTLPGKVVSVTGSSILMSKGNTTYTIDAAGVTPVNRKGAAITLADIKTGHKISVRGTVAGTTVTNILKLRDITLPVSTTTDTTETN